MAAGRDGGGMVGGHIIATYKISTSLTETISCPATNNSLPVAQLSQDYCNCQQIVSCYIPVVSLFYFLPHIQLPFVPIMQ